MRVREPTNRQIDVAVRWLYDAKDHGPLDDSCELVADWLRKFKTDRTKRLEARLAGKRRAR